MPHICPKCRYIRQTTDTAPEWQCPSCGVAYSKAAGEPASENYGRYGNNITSTSNPRASGSTFKIVVLLLVLVACALFARSLQQKRHARLLTQLQAQAQVQVAGQNSAQPQVILYGTTWCGYCAAARRLLTENHVPFTEWDVEKTTEGFEGHKKLGGGGVPVIVVNGEVMHGYSEQHLREMLAPWLSS